MGDQERMEELANVAKRVAKVGLPMQRQFQILRKAGLQLTDINWENCVSDPDLDTVIPVRPPAETSAAPAK